MIPDWLSGYRITGTWDEHIARGSTGGVDFGMPVGTPVYALTDCKVTFFYYGDGSSVIRQTRADGSKTEFLHGHLVGSPRTARGTAGCAGTAFRPGGAPRQAVPAGGHARAGRGRRARRHGRPGPGADPRLGHRAGAACHGGGGRRGGRPPACGAPGRGGQGGLSPHGRIRTRSTPRELRMTASYDGV